MTTAAHSATALDTAPPEAGERIWIAGDTVTIRAGAADTGGALTMLEVASRPGAGPPPHLHAREDEVFYVLAGAFELVIGDRRTLAGPGSFAFVPRGIVHRFQCIGPDPGRLLIVFTPGGLEGFFREAGVPAGDGPAPAVDDGEIGRTAVAGDRYGLTVVAWG
jgi:quercetin dioxygenase-like cupin family protein